MGKTNAILVASLVVLLSGCALLETSAFAAEPTQVFELPDGASMVMGSVSVRATGGFRGYRKGTDDQGDTFVFVRDGASESEYAVIVLERSAGAVAPVDERRAFREAFAYISLGVQAGEMTKRDWSQQEPILPDRKWTVNGVDFFHLTLEGTQENVSLRRTLVFATVGDDLISFDLQSPTSMWQVAFDGLAELVATVHLSESERQETSD